MPKRRFRSAKVKETSRRKFIPPGTFEKSPKEIARTLKAAVMKGGKGRSKTRFAAAMAMLNFYENRAGRNLTRKDRARIQRAKVELRRLFHKTQSDVAGLGDLVLFDQVTDMILGRR